MTDVDFQMQKGGRGGAAGIGLPMPNMMNIVNHPDRDTFGAPLHHLRFKRDQPGSPFHSTTTVHIPTESHPKTAMEVIEQMSDISGTITTLMRENVQLRTKLLNTKAPFWKKLMVNLQSSRTLFDEWRKSVMILREERRRAEIEARYFESIGEHRSALASVHLTKDQRIEQLEKELEITIKHTETLQDEVKKRDKDIQRYVKFFYEAQESFAKAAASNLPEDRDEVSLGFDLQHPAYLDEARSPDPIMVAELVVSKLHDILEAVDGRYVAPLQRGKNMHRRVKDVNELFHGYRMIQEKREALGAGKKLQPLKFDFQVPKVGVGSGVAGSPDASKSPSAGPKSPLQRFREDRHELRHSTQTASPWKGKEPSSIMFHDMEKDLFGKINNNMIHGHVPQSQNVYKDNVRTKLVGVGVDMQEARREQARQMREQQRLQQEGGAPTQITTKEKEIFEQLDEMYDAPRAKKDVYSPHRAVASTHRNVMALDIRKQGFETEPTRVTPRDIVAGLDDKMQATKLALASSSESA